VLKSLGIPLTASTLIATVTTVYMKLLESGQLPAYCPDITLDPSGGIGPASFALSLLLVFRTNSSYGRFQEVRGFFAGTTQRIRDLGRQVGRLSPHRGAHTPQPVPHPASRSTFCLYCRPAAEMGWTPS
jgi:predicted membrane chloride channel (bestrophin family)